MSIVNTEDGNMSEKKAREIRARINSLNSMLYAKKTEKNNIIAARDKVNELASGSMSKTKNSFEWTANKMNEYWNATDSSVRNMVQERLRKVASEFGDNGKITSELPGLLAKTEEKLLELDKEIEEIESEIASLEGSLRMDVA